MSSSVQAGAETGRNVFTVSRLNREVRMLLERGLGVVWVEGELSNFSQPSSGHWYFSLKDRDAQLRCAMFRLKNAALGFTPKAGQQVLVARPYQPVRAPRRLSAHCRAHGGGWRRRAEAGVRAPQGEARRRRAVRPRAQAQPAAISRGASVS